MKTKQEFIATATHSTSSGRIEFTGTESLTELLGRFGSGRLVHLYAADTLERLTTERDALKADAERYRAANTALVCALDRIHDVLNGYYVDDVAGIVIRALAANMEEPQ